MTGEEAAALEVSLAEMDSRLVAVIDRALEEVRVFPAAMPWWREMSAEHVARAVWAWLAEGDE